MSNTYIIAKPRRDGHSDYPAITIAAGEVIEKLISDNVIFDDKLNSGWLTSDICNNFKNELLKKVKTDKSTIDYYIKYYSKEKFFFSIAELLSLKEPVKIYKYIRY